MRTLFLVAVAIFMLSVSSEAQVKLQEGFETSDSTHLPLGWRTWNETGFPPYDSLALWTVQDTGLTIPGIGAVLRTVAHSGAKAIRVSWVAGVRADSSYLVADDWLISRRINDIVQNDTLRFWAAGGNGPLNPFFPDTLEIWLGEGDSLPSSQTLLLDVITWQSGSLYGVFRKYTYSLQDAAGLNIFVGFRYHTDVSFDGFCVYVDDIQVAGPLTDVQAPNGLPRDISLSQNYPNPFNPSTVFRYSLSTQESVHLALYDVLGRRIATLFEGVSKAGTHEVRFDASRLAAGIYFYRLQTGHSVQSRKMTVVK